MGGIVVQSEPTTVCYADMMQAARNPTILFGAFDRHNFGDLLFAHVAAAMLPDHDLVFAGLAERDLRAWGGHRVHAIAALAESLHEQPVNIIHAGGELLACDAWEAAVMLLEPGQVRQVVAQYDAQPKGRLQWAHSMLGISALAPYTVQRCLFQSGARILYNAVGGVDLGQRDAAMRAEVLGNLREADAIGVRDRRTLALLNAAGIPARLLPDPAVMLAELFDSEIRAHAQQGEVAALRGCCPQGYLAVQFSADFGDDATLAVIASQLEQVSSEHGYAVVLFRAGAAPWHDELAVYQRLAACMQMPVMLLDSLNVWDICSLIACSKGYCGSSLHGRIAAMAYALPRINLVHPAPAGMPGKQGAYAATWEPPGMPLTVEPSGMADCLRQALAADRQQLQQVGRELAARYREDFAALCAGVNVGTEKQEAEPGPRTRL